MNWRVQGFRAWLIQRLSAVYILAFLLVFLAMLAASYPLSYGAWRNMMGNSMMAVTTAIFFLAVIFHGWIGIRDVLIDYVHNFALRFAALALVGLALLAMALWMLRSLLVVAL